MPSAVRVYGFSKNAHAVFCPVWREMQNKAVVPDLAEQTRYGRFVAVCEAV